MKKRILPIYSIVAGVISLLLLAFLFFQYYWRKKEIEFYFSADGFVAADMVFILVLIFCFLFVSAVLLIVYRSNHKKWLKILTTVVVVVSIGCFLFVGSASALFMPYEYVELMSDDGEHCIIIAEDTYLFSIYGGDIYEKNSFCTMKKLTKYEAGVDAYYPFSNEKYTIVWGEDSVEITYDFDGKGEIYKTITVEYLK
jgi:magnesium-transporting ATPase (P-type)